MRIAGDGVLVAAAEGHCDAVASAGDCSFGDDAVKRLNPEWGER